MEAGEYGLTRGTCFVARRLELVAVAGLLWLSWCVLGGADLFVFFFSYSNEHGLLQSARSPCLIYLSTTACSAMSASAPKPRTLEVSLVWAREAMTMTTYTNVVLYVLSLWFIKNETPIACFLEAPT